MNRIILIGNGFDLAHNLDTSYKSFIKSYWKSILEDVRQEYGKAEYNNDDIKVINVPNKWEKELSYSSFLKSLNLSKSRLIFKNKFLERITKKTYLNKWVDIEIEYYELLKELINKPNTSDYDNISDLNKDFDRIRAGLIVYLKKVEEQSDFIYKNNFIKHEIGGKIYSPFKLEDFTEEVINFIVDLKFKKLEKDNPGFFSTLIDPKFLSAGTSPKSKLKEMLLSKKERISINLYPNKLLFLNFNYTSTDYMYGEATKYIDYQFKKRSGILEPEFIHIHGELNSKENPIIFGFGDELDKDYKTIEQLNDNDFLENIKSIKYLETDNYKKLLKFLNDDYFQVYIFGHSCGISDRTLLNTLFEHSNCGSIKVFYHKKDDDKDNYSDVIRNISRNFNNKAEMRDKVVNKKYCLPLIG